MRKSFLFSMLAAAISITASHGVRAADAVPKFDINRSCAAEAEVSAGIGETLDSCVKEEQQARATLVQQWSTYAAEDKASCTRESSIDGTPSYVELETCLEMASDVHATTGQRR